MAIPAYLSKNGVTVYPVTVPQAIIDPETGEPANLGSDMEYTINGIHADQNGNFTITAAGLNAAADDHEHEISDITGLSDALDGKSNTDHTHDMITAISDGTNSISGEVTITGTGNVRVAQNNGNINITITPYITDIGNNIVDGNTENQLPIGIFTGTEEQWEAFKANMSNNVRYLVFIKE